MKVERSTLLLLFRLFRPIRCQGGNGAHPHTGCWLGRGLIYVCHISFSRIPYLKKEAQYVVGEMPRLCTAQRSSPSRFSLAKSAQAVCIEPYSLCMCAVFICEFSSTDRRLAMLILCRTVIFARPVLGSTPSSTGGSSQ